MTLTAKELNAQCRLHDDISKAPERRAALLSREAAKCKAECVRELLQRDAVRSSQVQKEVCEISAMMSQLRQKQESLLVWASHTAQEAEALFADRWAARKAELLQQ